MHYKSHCYGRVDESRRNIVVFGSQSERHSCVMVAQSILSLSHTDEVSNCWTRRLELIDVRLLTKRDIIGDKVLAHCI